MGAWVPSPLQKSVIDAALAGTKPSHIPSKLKNGVTKDQALEIVRKARANGYEIPLFKTVPPARRGPKAEKPAVPQPPKVVLPPLNHSELAALKKLCAEHRPIIEEAADRAGLSLEAYVRRMIAQRSERLAEIAAAAKQPERAE